MTHECARCGSCYHLPFDNWVVSKRRNVIICMNCYARLRACHFFLRAHGPGPRIQYDDYDNEFCRDLDLSDVTTPTEVFGITLPPLM